MAIIVGDWVPGALVRFSDLHFIIKLQDGLECICSHDYSADTGSSDSVVDSMRGLQLDALRTNVPTSTQHPLTNHASSEQQHLQRQPLPGALWDDRSSQDSLHRALSSFANDTMPYSWGEPILPEVAAEHAFAAFSFSLRNAV